MEHQKPQFAFLAVFLAKLPLAALVIANAIPLIGVVFWNWDAFLIVLLYWSENVVIGFYNILKIAIARLEHPLEIIIRVLPIAFFIFHYSAFTGMHGFFVLALFRDDTSFMHGSNWPCFLAFVQIFLRTVRQAFLAIPAQAYWVVAAMFISHGISFLYNYVGKREYATTSVEELMHQPYGRVVVMHIAIIFGGFLTIALGSPIGLLVMLVILKTGVDAALHNRQHKAIAAKGAS